MPPGPASADPADLPVVEVATDVIAALAPDGERRAVLVAPPGAGKTTLIPLLLLQAPWLTGRIVMLEPRRLATRAAARRMAHLLGGEPGETVGYQTRDERVIGADTRIEVVTEGVLTRRLQHDPSLPGVDVVIFDEVHERNLPTDLGLAFALDAAASLRPDLAILAMSATADTRRLAEVLGIDEPAPVIVSEGRQYPVDIRWLPRERRSRLESAVVSAVQRALRDEPGDVLVFLPGIGEIMRTAAELRRTLADHVDVRPLAGALSVAEQDAALEASPPGRRRVVLATDIAETSLTVDGVRIVVDSGVARAPRFDVRTEMTRLSTVSISRASAEQRAGRAGRLEPGVCYRLWSKIEHTARSAHAPAEILEVDLSGLALELAAWGGQVEHLAFMDPPPERALRAGRELLTSLGALDEHGLTERGRQMLSLPVHPRLAAMIAAQPGSLACVVAAVVDERDVMRRGSDRDDDAATADLTRRVAVVCGLEHHDRADPRAVARVRERARDLARRAGVRFDPDSVDVDDTGAVLLTAFADRLAGRRRPGQFQLLGGSGAWLPETDPLANEPFVVAVDLDGKRDRARIRLAAPVDADAVATQFADRLAVTTNLQWDRDRDDLVAVRERRLGAINLGTTSGRAEAGPETTAQLLERVRRTGLAQLGWSAAAISVRQRVEFLHRQVGAPWPDWSVDHLVATVDEWLAPWITGATCRADLEALDVAVLLRSSLPWEVGADLDRLAPPELELPNGKRVPLDYGDAAPAASVRVQWVYGVDRHPSAAGIPVVLTLLSPADRPIQITADLPGFWRGSWAQVRTEMAGRYPKHHWPEHPEAP